MSTSPIFRPYESKLAIECIMPECKDPKCDYFHDGQIHKTFEKYKGKARRAMNCHLRYCRGKVDACHEAHLPFSSGIIPRYCEYNPCTRDRCRYAHPSWIRLEVKKRELRAETSEPKRQRIEHVPPPEEVGKVKAKTMNENILEKLNEYEEDLGAFMKILSEDGISPTLLQSLRVPLEIIKREKEMRK